MNIQAIIGLSALVVLMVFVIGKLLAPRRSQPDELRYRPATHSLQHRTYSPEAPLAPGTNVPRDAAIEEAEPEQSMTPMDEEEDFDADKLTAELWPTAVGDTPADRVEHFLVAAQKRMDCSWEDGSYGDPLKPEDFSEPLRRQGCTTSDMIIAFHRQTDQQLGDITSDLIPWEVTTTDLGQAIRDGKIVLDQEEMENITDATSFEWTDVVEICHTGGMDAKSSIKNIHEQYQLDSDDLEQLIERAVSIGYQPAEVMDAVADLDIHWSTIVECTINKLPYDVILSGLRPHLDAIDLEELEDNLRSDTNIPQARRVKLLHDLHIAQAAVPAPAEPAAPSEA